MKTLIACIVVLCVATIAHGQSCYSSAYVAPQPVALQAVSCQQQAVSVVHTVAVAQPVVQTVAVQQVAVAAPCQAVSYAAPVALPLAVAYVPVTTYAPSFSMRVRSPNNAHLLRGSGVEGVGAGGVSVSARDRRGTVVTATGNNHVRIERGIFGQIRGARADANRGLLGRISPF